MQNEWLETDTKTPKFFGLTTEQWKEKYGQDVITWMPITDARLAFYHITQKDSKCKTNG